MTGKALIVARVVVAIFLLPALWLVFSTAQQVHDQAGTGSIGGIITLAGAVSASFWAPLLLAVRGRIPLAVMAIAVIVLMHRVVATYLYADPYAVASGSGDTIAFLLFFSLVGAVVAYFIERKTRRKSA